MTDLLTEINQLRTELRQIKTTQLRADVVTVEADVVTLQADIAGLDHGADLAGLLDDDHTNLLNSARHASEDHDGLGGDVVFADLGPVAGSPLDISEVTDVTIVTTDITGVVVGDLLIAKLWGTGLNNTGLNREWIFTPDFDAAFDPEDSVANIDPSATERHYYYVEWTLAVVATNDARMTGKRTTNPISEADGQWGDVGGTGEQETVWGRVTSDLTGTVTVSLVVRSNSTAATQEFLLDSFVVRKISST